MREYSSCETEYENELLDFDWYIHNVLFIPDNRSVRVICFYSSSESGANCISVANIDMAKNVKIYKEYSSDILSESFMSQLIKYIIHTEPIHINKEFMSFSCIFLI